MRAAQFLTCKNPKSNDLHALAHYQVLGDHADKLFDYFYGLRLVELMLLRQLIGQMLDGDRLWGRRLLCRCDVKHGRSLLMHTMRLCGA